MNNFITREIEKELNLNKNKKVVVRFPPEPNGYLHLGHAKSIIINSEVAKKFNGEFNLRFDDTNPDKETEEYVNAIKKDAFWLVNNFNNVYWTSNYFDELYECAILLIKKGLAYIDDHNIDEIKEMRGNFHNKGIESKFRNRSIEENLNLFEKMKLGKYKDGEKVLRAKIDMTHENMNMRDPIIYRVRHSHHHNTGNKWCIYPMYDFAHPLSDGLEGITYSLCTLEFENHRILYDWFIENCRELLNSTPKELEFSELNVTGIVLSKRKLNAFVEESKVNGWNDPRFPTISGMRERGFTPEMLFDFIERSGVSKVNTEIDYEILNETVRDSLHLEANRTMAVLNPVELEIINFEEHFNNSIEIETPLHPKNKERGNRIVNLSKTIYVEESDVKLTPEKGFWRIYEGNTVRLKYGYNIEIKEIFSLNGKPIKILAELDVESKNMKKAKKKAKAALHWISEVDKLDYKINLYENIILEGGEFNNNSKIEKVAYLHKSLKNINDRLEFERLGYFYLNNNEGHLLTYIKNKR